MSPMLKRTTRVTLHAIALLAALGGVYFVTRDSSAQTVIAAGESHDDHGKAATGADAPRSVSLTAEQGRRIGVTYALATVGPLEKDVRAVGQIAYDETRVKSISPKIDG